MKLIDKYFKSLSFVGVDDKYQLCGDNFSAFSSKSNLLFCNRVFINEKITIEELKKVTNFFKPFPFSVWINEENKLGIHLASKAGFNFHTAYPLMTVKLNEIQVDPKNKNIFIKKITSEFDILNLWVSLVVKSYGIKNISDFQKYISCLLNTAKFYVGYYEDKPVATNMTIFRNDTVDIHWIGTLPEFRNRGLGQAVTCFPLFQEKTSATKAILYASSMGRPLYEKMGFVLAGTCFVYK